MVKMYICFSAKPGNSGEAILLQVRLINPFNLQ